MLKYISVLLLMTTAFLTGCSKEETKVSYKVFDIEVYKTLVYDYNTTIPPEELDKYFTENVIKDVLPNYLPRVRGNELVTLEELNLPDLEFSIRNITEVDDGSISVDILVNEFNINLYYYLNEDGKIYEYSVFYPEDCWINET